VKVLFFDIDGTLLHAGGAGRRAFSLALADVLGVDDDLRSIPFDGRTDPGIWSDICIRHGAARSYALDRLFFERYLRHLERLLSERDGEGGLYPGVLALLEILAQRQEIRSSILTGNIEQGAALKLAAFGILPYFARGAYGSDHHDRTSLGPIALERMGSLLGRRLEPGASVVVGDTPFDIACARAAGMRSLAVATGRYGLEQLARAGADAVLADLSDHARALEAIGLA